MQVNMSQDYRSVDNTEQVTYTSVRQTGSLSDTLTAKRRGLSRKELLGSAGAYTGDDVVLLLFDATLVNLFQQVDPNIATGGGPKPGDNWTDANQVTWTVLEVGGGKRDSSGRLQTWRLVCRDLVLHYDLRDTIDIQAPGLSTDAAGATVKSWPDDPVPGGKVLYPGLAAKVQVKELALADFEGLREFLGDYAIPVAKQVSLTGDERVKWVRPGTKTPTYLNIKGVHNLGQINELPVLDTSKVP